MSTLDELITAARLDPERVFSAPWEARAFAIAVQLSAAGVFTWDEFRTHLIEEVGKSDRARMASGANAEADDEHYYEHFLHALEHLLSEKGVAN
jgi:nitrile hydratase accessory protein